VTVSTSQRLADLLVEIDADAPATLRIIVDANRQADEIKQLQAIMESSQNTTTVTYSLSSI